MATAPALLWVPPRSQHICLAHAREVHPPAHTPESWLGLHHSAGWGTLHSRLPQALMEHLRTVVHSHRPSCCWGPHRCSYMFRPGHPRGHPVVSVPDGVLSPGTSMTPCPTPVRRGIKLVIFYSKIVCSGGQSSCVDFSLRAPGKHVPKPSTVTSDTRLPFLRSKTPDLV
jgi:hypothetical protein